MFHSSTDRLEKISLQWIASEKLDRQSRTSDKRPENPGDLAAQKKISSQPCKQHKPGSAPVSGSLSQQQKKTVISCHAGKANHSDMREQHHTVACQRQGIRQGRRVPKQKKHDRGKCSQNK